MTGLIPMLNEAAMYAHRRIFWYTPYRTGNLARNGIGDVGTLYAGNWGYSVGFHMFGRPGTEYGAILNEAQVIRYKAIDPVTGRVHTGQYNNRHYMWVDNFADAFAAELPLLLPVRRVS